MPFGPEKSLSRKVFSYCNRMGEKKNSLLLTNVHVLYVKVRQDVTDYKLELKISVCMLVNFEFRILTWNFEF